MINVLLMQSISQVFVMCSPFKGDWIRKRFETPGIISLDAEDKRTLLKRLIRSTGYELIHHEKM